MSFWSLKFLNMFENVFKHFRIVLNIFESFREEVEFFRIVFGYESLHRTGKKQEDSEFQGPGF